MTNVHELIDRYFAMWNETDAKRRREIIARTWSEDATYVDPKLKGEGHAGIDVMVQGLQQQINGLKFRQTSEVDFHNDRVRFSWELGPEGGEAIADGVDFGVVANSRLKSITGFIDHAPAA